MARVPIAEGLFTWPSDDPRLIGSACTACDLVVFPAQTHCPGCFGGEVTEHLLEPRGSLYTWTTQSFPPVAPPYIGDTDPDDLRAVRDGLGPGVGHLDDRVEADRERSRQARVRDAGRARADPAAVDDEGNEVVSFAFAPAS